MPHPGPRRTPGFIEPFRVKPGRRVRLARDVDPVIGVGAARESQARELLARMWKG